MVVVSLCCGDIVMKQHVCAGESALYTVSFDLRFS